MGILGINAISPFAGPVRITASIILFRNNFICNHVPLHKFDGWRLRNNVIGAPIFDFSLWGGNPEGERELRNSCG
jgi:hypothetical protein